MVGLIIFWGGCTSGGICKSPFAPLLAPSLSLLLSLLSMGFCIAMCVRDGARAFTLRNMELDTTSKNWS